MYLYTRIAYDRIRIPRRRYHAYKISSEKNKKCRSIDVDKVGSKKTFSEWMLFRVGLIGSSFLDLISKQARLNAAVRSFLFDITTIVSSQCKALFGLLCLKKQQKLFVIQLSKLWMDGFIFSALKDSENQRSPLYWWYCSLKLVFVCITYVCMVMLLWWRLSKILFRLYQGQTKIIC